MPFKRLMRPLARVFRPAPPAAPTLETQVSALDSSSPETLIATIFGDAEEALRAAAVRKLPDGEVLRSLAGLGDNAAHPARARLERIAQERVAQLVDTQSIDFASLPSTSGNLGALLSVAELCSNPAYLDQALASLKDPQLLAKLVVEGSSSHIRQLAAQRIEDPTELTRLLKVARDKDKNAYKIIKQKCDVLRAEKQRIAQIESDVTTLCATLERHSHRYYDALYEPSFRDFETRWRVLEAQAAPQAREHALQAIERCREVIAAHGRLLAEKAERAAREAAQQAAREEASSLAAAEAQRRDEIAALAAAEAATRREAEEKAGAEKLAADTHALHQIAGLMAKANGALRDGNTGRAAGLRRAIEEKLATAPTMPAHIDKQLRQLDAKLNELKGWKDYAVAPKRAELIAEMESLIGSSEAPQALADRIKQLQEDWKTVSKGIVSDSEADWQRFHQASVTAYQPCRDYFEAQSKLRHENLELRRSVLKRLQAFAAAQSGEQPDWRAIAAVLREARQEWRRHSPVDRAAGLAVQEEFDASLAGLQGRLNAWHARNVADKKAFIQRAQHLLTKEDGREAVDAVKRLQLQWKEIGPAPRDQEQSLWNEFREHCDAVYQKRQQAFADYTAGLEANKGHAAALCAEAEQLATQSGPNLLEGMAKIPEWRSAFEALGEMPRADQRALHDRFERALSRCQAEVLKMRARDKEQSFTHLFEAARLIQAYGLTVASNAASADRESLKQTAENFIADVRQWPKGGVQALKDAWSKADAAAGLDMTAQETALRMLCIRSEILTDRPTPPEDQALRREYQVQRLVQRMGQQGEANPDDLDALALEWVRVGPAPAGAHEPLLSRFIRCR